jgi:Carboxypeptidase regulatory-like domain
MKYKALWGLLSLFLFATLAHAQAGANIVGTVTDPSGAVVPSAKVTVVQEGTGFAQTVRANSSGYFVVPSLHPATYKLNVNSAGFQAYVQEGITLEANQSVTVNVALTLGAATKSVTVHGAAALVNTTTSTLNEVVDQRRVVDLPLNGRNAATLTLLVSGTAISPNSNADQGPQKTFPGAVTVSANGSRGNTTNYQLDGANFNDEYTNVNAPFPFPDAVQEFSVQTANYSAQFGQNSGGQVNVVTKSGTNRLHGDGFEFNRNAVFNARNFFAADRDQLKRNQFGGTVGGPVVLPGVYNGHDRTFFFFGYQATRMRNVPGGATAQVPTDAEINGDFSALLDPNNPDNPNPGKTTKIIDPATGQAFLNNQIPTSSFDPASVELLKFLPRATGTGRVFFLGAGQHYDLNEYVERVDHAISDKDRFTFRGTFNKFDNAPFLDLKNALTYTLGSKIEAQDYLAHETHIFRPNLMNDFRFSYFRELTLRLPPPNSFNPSDLGISLNGFEPPPNAFNKLNVKGFFSFGKNSLAKFVRNSYNWADDVTLIEGSHHITFGGSFEHSQFNLRNQTSTHGQFTFTKDVTNFAVASFLLGKLNQFSQDSKGSFVEERNNIMGIYLQDDWRVARRLTLNLGIRYEPSWPWRDKQNRVTQFRPEDAVVGVTSQVFVNAPPGVFFFGDAGVPPRGTWGDFNNVAPRLGFAYDVLGDGRTSLRGGAALVYNSRVNAFLSSNISTGTPFSTSVDVLNPQGSFSNPLLGFGNPLPAPDPPPPDAPFPLPMGVVSFDPSENLHISDTYEWNLALEHEFQSSWMVRAAYVGSRATHLRHTVELNPAQYIPGNDAFNAMPTDDRRVFAAEGLGSVSINGQDVNSLYNSLQLTVQKRFTRGAPNWLRDLTLLANYTYSRSLDDLPFGATQVLIGDSVDAVSTLPYGSPFLHQMDFGRSDFDHKHAVVLSYVWQLPGLRGSNKYSRNLLGGWTASGILTAQSGGPITVLAGADRSQTALNADRGVLLGEPKGPGACQNVAPCVDFLNPSSFALPAIGTFGNMGKGSINGPDLTTWDMGFFKDIPLHSERYRLQFRAEFFNIFNRVNFNNLVFAGSPTNAVGGGGFGQILGAGDPRIGQLALKVFF